MLLTGMKSILDRAGLEVVEMDGWRSRGATDGPFNPKGIMLHHDGMGLGFNKNPNDDFNVPKNMSKAGTNGSQIWISNKGIVALVAAGRTWHAGEGKGWGKIPANRGNEFTIGFETDHYPGNPWPKVQLDAIDIASKAFYDEFGFTTDYCCGHKEYAPNRKADPERFDLNAWRAFLEEDMPTPAEFAKAMLDQTIDVKDAYYGWLGRTTKRNLTLRQLLAEDFERQSILTRDSLISRGFKPEDVQ